MNNNNHSSNDNTDRLYSISQLGRDILELISLIPKDSEHSGCVQRLVGVAIDEITVN